MLTKVSGDLIGQNTVTNQNIAASVQDAYGWRNRIINGDMRIDQRNNGASVAVNSSTNFFTVDRFLGTGQTTDGVFTIQQSTTAPAGFTNSLAATVTTADTSLGTTQRYAVGQLVEGFNVADLGWGAPGAQTITLSFWVRSSLTGTFGGSVVNSGFDRSYPFTYTIAAANTFEYKTVTIDGDTSGTWLKNNAVGLRLYFSLGAGTDRSGTAGAWNGNNNFSATGAVSVIGTLNATWYITGVQLEAGSVATAFERRDYGRELAMCQRYLPAWNFNGVNQPSAAGVAYSTTATVMNLIHPVQTRVPPTGISVTGTFNSYNNAGGNAGNFSSITLGASQGTYSSIINCTGGSGLVVGNATILLSPSGTSQILLTGCEL